ncbi:hypothetical protein BT96DRAFT_1043303 [Gymnopus androsaceus JB14]|uniref:Uncharacterized protein n=1 Tax=Gymnopus androsaceus JB14 TaxID=1447944 RepID=A0A6A4HBM4_9AGAR|nr:hypothetical protein BT96DRAFT_1043303 [Gymnopus androsaceus JB14]
MLSVDTCSALATFWDDDGTFIHESTVGANDCYESDFDQYGDMEAFGVHPDWSTSSTGSVPTINNVSYMTSSANVIVQGVSRTTQTKICIEGLWFRGRINYLRHNSRPPPKFHVVIYDVNLSAPQARKVEDDKRPASPVAPPHLDATFRPQTRIIGGLVDMVVRPKTAKWVVDNKLFSHNVRWLIQIDIAADAGSTLSAQRKTVETALLCVWCLRRLRQVNMFGSHDCIKRCSLRGYGDILARKSKHVAVGGEILINATVAQTNRL